LNHFANDKGYECGVTISNIKDTDEGRWRCNIGVVENSEVTTASGMANLSIAVSPEDIFLEAPFNQPEVNITAEFPKAGELDVIPVKCVVENAKPAPTFNWTIGGVPATGETRDEEEYVTVEGVSTFAQTINLIPNPDYNNQSLVCVINHPGLIKPVTVETLLKIDAEEWMDTFNAGKSTSEDQTTTITLATVLPILVILALIMFVLRHRLRRLVVKKDTKTDSSSRLEQGEAKEGDDATEEQKPVLESTNEQGEAQAPEGETQEGAGPVEEGEEVPVKKTMNARIAEFIAGNFRRKNEKKTGLDDTAAPEFEKVETGDVEEGGEKDDTEQEKDTKKTPIKDRVRTLIERFQKKTAAAKDELELAVGEENPPKTEETEENKMAAETENKMAELEPEDKEKTIEAEKKIGSETPV